MAGHKAIVPGPVSAGQLFRPSMLKKCPFFLVSAHFTSCLPLVVFNLPQFILSSDQTAPKEAV